MKKLFVGIAAALALAGFLLSLQQSVSAAIPTTINIPLTPTPSGVNNTKFPDGNDGTPATPLTWNNACLAALPSFTAGTAGSVDISSCLDHPASGWTITPLLDPGLTGVSFNGTSQSCSIACVAATGTYRFRATYSGQLADSFDVIRQIAAVNVADTTAPTAPFGLAGTSASNNVTLRWKPSADTFDTRAGTGIDHYEVLRDGSHFSNVAAPLGVSPPWNQVILGSPTTAATTQTGTSFAFSCEGLGIHNTATESACYRMAAVSGDATVVSRASAFTSSFQYSTGGITGFYNSAAQGAPFFVGYWEPSAQNFGFQVKYRTTQGGISTNLIASIQGLNPPGCIVVSSSGTTFNAYTGDASCNTLTLAASQSIPALAASKFAVGGLASQIAGVVANITLTSLGVTQSPDLSTTFADTGTHSYSIRGYDVAGNVSAATAPVSITSTVVSASAHRWHPGIYLLSVGQMSPTDNGYTNAIVDDLANYPDVKGFEQVAWWSTLEPTRGNYDFSKPDALCARLAGIGKKFVMQVVDRSFSGHTSVKLPGYLNTEIAGGGIATKTLAGKEYGVVARLWVPAIMDREIALYTAIAAHYEGMPCFEGVFTSESDPGQGITEVPDFNSTTYVNQLLRRMQTIAPLFKKANLFESVNFLPTGQAATQDYVAQMKINKVLLTAPDVKVTGADGMGWAFHVLNGYKWSPTATSPSGNKGWWATGGINYVDDIGAGTDIEDVDMGGSVGTGTMQEFYDEVTNYHHVHYLFWSMKNYVLVGYNVKQGFWDGDHFSGVLPAAGKQTVDVKTFVLAGGHPLKTGCPASYAAGGCDTSP